MIPWWTGGIGIGLVLIVAVAFVQPIGVSAQYVVLDGVLLHHVLPDRASKSPYLAKTAQGWTLATYEFFFVLGIPRHLDCDALGNRLYLVCDAIA